MLLCKKNVPYFTRPVMATDNNVPPCAQAITINHSECSYSIYVKSSMELKGKLLFVTCLEVTLHADSNTRVTNIY